MDSPPADACFRFGPFTLHPRRKLLLDSRGPVALGSRALELLVVLAQHSGEVLGRDELERHVWPRSVVEETSLRVHVSRLRKALHDGEDGARYIVNVPGRGYVFVGDVVAAPGDEVPRMRPDLPRPPSQPSRGA